MRRYKGYTLLELICLIVCLAILIVLSSFTWRHYSADIKRYVMAQRIKSALLYTRSRAIRLNKAVAYCGSSDGRYCDGNWLAGQLIKVVQTGRILKTFSSLDKDIQVKFTANFGRQKYIKYLASGETDGQQGHFSICSLPKASILQHCTWVKVQMAGQVQLNERRL